MDEPVGLSALDDAARGALRRARRLGWAWFVVGLAGFVVTLALISAMQDRADALQADGARRPAVVVERRPGGEDGFIVVGYEWRGGRVVGTVRLDDTSPHYRLGQHVTALVDRADPAHMTIRGEDNDPGWAVWVLSIGLVGGPWCFGFGAWALGRARQQRRVLAASRWTLETWHYRVVGPALSRRALASLGEGGELLRLSTVSRWRMARSGLRRASEVEAAGDPARRIVVRVPGHDVLMTGRPARTTRSARRWARWWGR